MQALFDRLSHPFGDRKVYQIQRAAGFILENHLPDFASRAEHAEHFLKSRDKSGLPEHADCIKMISAGFSQGNKRVGNFKARILASIAELLMLLNRTDPDQSFHTLLSSRLDLDFDNEVEAFLGYRNEMLGRIRAGSGGPGDFRRLAAEKADQVTDEFLLFLKSKNGRKRICNGITKVFNEENSPRKRGLESICDQLQRIVGTKVYSDTDSPLKTILNFGLPSIVTVSVGNGNQYDRVCRLARDSIEAFEPRLADPHVYFVENEDAENRIQCIIEGRIATGGDTEILKFPMKL